MTVLVLVNFMQISTGYSQLTRTETQNYLSTKRPQADNINHSTPDLMSGRDVFSVPTSTFVPVQRNNNNPVQTVMDRNVSHHPVSQGFNHLKRLLTQVGSCKTEELSSYIDRLRIREKENKVGMAVFKSEKSIFSELCFELAKLTFKKPSIKQVFIDHIIKGKSLDVECHLLRAMDNLSKNHIGMTINEMLDKAKEQSYKNEQGTEQLMKYLAVGEEKLSDDSAQAALPEITRHFHHNQRCASNSVKPVLVTSGGVILASLPGTGAYNAFCCNGTGEGGGFANICDGHKDCPDGSDEMNCLNLSPKPEFNCFRKECSLQKTDRDYDSYCCTSKNQTDNDFGYLLKYDIHLCNNITECSDGYDEESKSCRLEAFGINSIGYFPIHNANCHSSECRFAHDESGIETSTTQPSSITTIQNSIQNSSGFAWPGVLIGAAMVTTGFGYCLSLVRNRNVIREKGFCYWLATPPKHLFNYLRKSPCSFASPEEHELAVVVSR